VAETSTKKRKARWEHTKYWLGINRANARPLNVLAQVTLLKQEENSMAHVILFEHAGFHGAHKHVFRDEANLNSGDDHFFNDRTSSIVVLEGNWEFFIDAGHVGKLGRTLGPGLYDWVEAALGPSSNDRISSLRPV